MLVVPILLWALRGQVPAAGLAVTEARITQSIDELTPGAPVRTLAPADLHARRDRLCRDSRSGRAWRKR